MQMVSEIMTRNVRFVAPQENLQHAAQLMDELNVGVLPVCEGDRLIGMITDRDITVRATAAGVVPDDALVEEAMSGNVRWCFEDQSVDEVMQQMADTQIRRVPVVSHDDAHRLIGIVALGDIATKSGDGENAGAVAQVVEQVSTPSMPEQDASGNQFEPGEGLSSGADVAGAATTGSQATEKVVGDALSGSAIGADGTPGATVDKDAAPDAGIATALDAMPGAPTDTMTCDGTGGDLDADTGDASQAGAFTGAATGAGVGGGAEVLSPDDQDAVAKAAAALDPQRQEQANNAAKAPSNGSAA